MAEPIFEISTYNVTTGLAGDHFHQDHRRPGDQVEKWPVDFRDRMISAHRKE